MNYSAITRGARSRSTGFSLIEVLVALLVLLIGLLGVVRMQLLSVQNNQGAYLRTQATYIAADMMDRMRANREGRNWGLVTSPSDLYEDFDTQTSTIPGAQNCHTTVNGCTAQQVAQIDMREIAAMFDPALSNDDNFIPVLPEGRLTVGKNPDGPGDGFNDEYVVTVTWSQQDWEEDAGGNVLRGGSVQRTVELRSMIRRTEGNIGTPSTVTSPGGATGGLGET